MPDVNVECATICLMPRWNTLFRWVFKHVIISRLLFLI